MNLETLRARIHDAGLSRVESEILGLARPSLLLRHTSTDEAPVGSTKIGGNPDLPDAFVWPTWRGAPLAFLAQVNCSELRNTPVADLLPSRGLLAFFYDVEQSTWGFDPNDAGSWSVHWIEAETSALRRRPFPDGLPDHGQYEECALAFEETLSIPGWETPSVESLGLTEEERKELYYDLLEQITEEGPRHKILGYAEEVQGEMQMECQLASNGVSCGDIVDHDSPRVKELAAGAADWRLLFQLDTDDNARMMWGDCGRLYFWIRALDLASRRFDATWMVLQCG